MDMAYLFYPVLFALFMTGLYFGGLLPVRMMRAAVYIGSGSWKHCCFGASVTRCTGRIFRVLRVKESRSYSFRLSGHMQQGVMRVELRGDATLLVLSREAPTATVSLEKGRSYRLTLFFENASGDYQLEWD